MQNACNVRILGDDVFWSAGVPTLVWKGPKSGGTPVRLWSAEKNLDEVKELVPAADNLYVFLDGPDGARIVRVPYQEGKAAEVMYSQPRGICGGQADDKLVYWTTAEGVRRAPKEGAGSAAQVQELSPAVACVSASDGANLFGIDWRRKALLRIAKSDGAVTVLVDGLDERSLTHQRLPQDDAAIYVWRLNKKGTAYDILRVSKQ
jgi:hypothetical protein